MKKSSFSDSIAKQPLRQGSPELAEGLSMNGRNYNDFKVATVRPEPVEGCSFIFLITIELQPVSKDVVA